MKHLKDKIKNVQTKRSGELSSRFYETYKNTVKLYGCHIHFTAADMSWATMCPCTSQHHGLPHWKYLLHCCKKLPSLSITRLEKIKMKQKCVQQYVLTST